MDAQHLVTEVRRGVYHKGGSGGFNQYAGAKPFVFFIRRCANVAGTGDHRDAAACTGAKKSYFQLWVTHLTNVNAYLR